ncbi:MAG: filamentous hemagglutinin N-terminal domain-containing protein, partial [Candidatus Nanopelagicaceae bacterium]
MNHQLSQLLQITIVLSSSLLPLAAQAQVTPDDTLPDNTVVTPQGETIEIEGGTTRGNNLFHSFQEFSVPTNREAQFNNADTIENILSRVTGGAESVINGRISANGSANLFLINPAGIIFGENASLNVGGSFIGSTADNLLFPDGVEYSATDTDVQPTLTINAPIGLGFRDAPQPITNSSLFDVDNLVGLSVPKDATLALIGGDIDLEGGIMSTDGGRIELGSVGENSTVGLRAVAQGWDLDYSEVENFLDLNLTEGAFVESRGADTGDIQVQARNISLLEGSEIAINTNEGVAGNLKVVATDSLEISGNGAELDLGEFESSIFNNVEDSATGADSTLTVNTNRLTLNNGGQITAKTLGSGQGADIVIAAGEISIGEPFSFDVDDFITSVISAPTDLSSSGNGGDIAIETTRLNIDSGGAINTDTSGSGNGGSLQVNATESIELTGTIPENISTKLEPSQLAAGIGQTTTAIGNAGDIAVK